MSEPLLSIVIVSWNVRVLLRNCIESIHAHMKLPREQWELIVVDNDSGDGSADLVLNEFPDAVLIRNPVNDGFAKGNNRGFQVSRGKWILLLNPDTVLVEDTAGRMLEEIASRPGTAALGCMLLNADGTFQRWTGGRGPNLRNALCHFLLLYKIFPPAMLPRPMYLERQPTADMEVDWVSGACMMLRREALGENIFDETFFMYCEDLELCRRLARNGWKIRFTVRTRIIHFEGQSIAAQSADVQVSKVRNLRRFFSMDHAGISLFAYDCTVIAGFIMRAGINGAAAAVRPGRGFGRRARASTLYAGEALRGLLTRRLPKG